MFRFRMDDSASCSLELVILTSVARPEDRRPIRRFHPSWLYCRVRNVHDRPLFVYGPRHPSDLTSLPSSLFLLPTSESTPKKWDCKGVLIPADCIVSHRDLVTYGPIVLKYRDMRRVTVRGEDKQYICPQSDGIKSPGQLDFNVPLLSYAELLQLTRTFVSI